MSAAERSRITYDYALIRVVPRVDREEFVNVGVILACQSHATPGGYLAARVELDAARLRALDPDIDLAAIEAHLATIPAICSGAGPLGKLSRRERFDWLTAPRSALIQTSSVHTGRCTDAGSAMEHLLATMVRVQSR